MSLGYSENQAKLVRKDGQVAVQIFIDVSDFGERRQKLALATGLSAATDFVLQLRSLTDEQVEEQLRETSIGVVSSCLTQQH